MEMPFDLIASMEKLANGLSQSDLKQAAQTLSLRYRSPERTGQPLLSNRTEAAAYAITRMPATYGAVYSALTWGLEHTDCRPRTLLDVGAGTGAAAWAVDQVLKLDAITCLEKENSMKTQGLALMNDTLLQKTAWVSGDLDGEIPYTADLVTVSYVLNEIAPQRRQAAMDKLWACANQLLLIVEPGTPAGFAQLREARDYFLSKGAHLAAPCPHGSACPVTGEDWCHFTCRIPRTRLHRLLKGGDVPYEDEKFTYLLLSKTPVTPCEARVLRHPVIETGRVTLELCRACGKEICTLRKKDSAYKAARKLDCGDSFSVDR